ncbi:MAG: 5'/3'-nucleotidase SurE [Muribaculaceae bacterium]|nr:5'/3'-nucleotidase SurE [Muribaculaceae bacterium]
MKRPLIFISNDDSVAAPGLHKLIDFVKDLGDIIAVAPEEPQSGMSSAFTVDKALRIHECEDYNGARVFTVNGTPVDCVKLGLYAITPRKPDIMLAGINHGSNSGNSIIYSGTMGAVLEACMEGIPSVGFSLLHHSIKADFDLSASYVKEIVEKVLEEGLPKDICLNVNIPAKVIPVGVRVCRAAKGHWSDGYCRYLDPQGNPFYLVKGKFINEDADATDTDEYWLARNYISVVLVNPDMSSTPDIKEMSRRLDTKDML